MYPSVPELIAEKAVWTRTWPGRSFGSGMSRSTACPPWAKTRFIDSSRLPRSGPAPRSHPPARTLCARRGWESTLFRAISPRRLRPGGATVRDFGQLDAYVADHRDGWIAELVDAARQPSVSATGDGIAPMGQRVLARLRAAGATADLVESGVSHPAVIAEIGAGPRSVLLYDHYDVQ